MAPPNLSMGELISTTLRKRRKSIADTVTKNNGIVFQMRRKNKITTEDGGRTISSPLMYDENGNFAYYEGYDPLLIAPQEVISSAEYQWKQWAASVTISGRELMQNSGKSALINILNQRVINAERTIANRTAEGIYSDGTGDGGKQIGGLQFLVSDAPGATVGGIDSATWTFWDNQRIGIVGGPTTANIYPNMLALYLACSRGSDKIDLIMADNTYYSVYAESLQDKQRFTNSKMAAAGFDNLMFMGAPVVVDGALGGYAPVGMYFLNCDHLGMTMHSKRNNTVLPGPERTLTQDSTTRTIAGMGNMTCSNRMLQGRLYTA